MTDHSKVRQAIEETIGEHRRTIDELEASIASAQHRKPMAL